ncbi:MAG: hypothetical protein J5J06_00950 [Phycisphaerae bacterium]|nr:hypothetical protein [Phycisphaerae bacterium]
MMAEEREQLVRFFDEGRCWCQHAEARNASGDPVQYDDPDATAWDLTGALCRLFGWQRATVLFGQIERHLEPGKHRMHYLRDEIVDPMCVLQQFNDRDETAFADIIEQVQSIPLWRGAPKTVGMENAG